MNKSSLRNPLRCLAHEYSLAMVFCYFYYCNQGCFNCAQKGHPSLFSFMMDCGSLSAGTFLESFSTHVLKIFTV